MTAAIRHRPMMNCHCVPCCALREAAVAIPAERLLVETDCPYMAPVPMRGKRNEPAFVAYTARRVAELRGMAEDALAEAAFENGCRLFGME